MWTVFSRKRNPSHDLLSSSLTLNSLEKIRWMMSYRISLGKYIVSTAPIALLALTWDFEWRQNSWDLVIRISQRISVHLAVHWCPLNWEFQLRKKMKCFWKDYNCLFLPFWKRERKIISQYKGSIPYLPILFGLWLLNYLLGSILFGKLSLSWGNNLFSSPL